LECYRDFTISDARENVGECTDAILQLNTLYRCYLSTSGGQGLPGELLRLTVATPQVEPAGTPPTGAKTAGEQRKPTADAQENNRNKALKAAKQLG